MEKCSTLKWPFSPETKFEQMEKGFVFPESLTDPSSDAVQQRCRSLIFKDNKEQNIEVRRSITLQ
jgi:hypothetical protein